MSLVTKLDFIKKNRPKTYYKFVLCTSMQSKYGFITLSAVLLFFLFGQNYALAAPSLSIQTDKTVYEYGDHLSLIFNVSDLTGDSIIIQIIDSSGKLGSPVSIPITSMKTQITAPDAFYKTTFKPGIYHINAAYSGSNSTVVFTLIDSNKIAIPSYDKNIIKLWSSGQQYTDASFANVIRELVQSNIIQVSESNNNTANVVHIPSWVRNDAKWWSEDLISDNDFALGIQYLIEAKIITV